MHLKNFSLLDTGEGLFKLAPAYDLVNTKLVMPRDREEIALTLNGKKAKLAKRDFDQFAKNLKINDRTLRNMYTLFLNESNTMLQWIKKSFFTSVHEGRI